MSDRLLEEINVAVKAANEVEQTARTAQAEFTDRVAHEGYPHRGGAAV